MEQATQHFHSAFHDAVRSRNAKQHYDTELQAAQQAALTEFIYSLSHDLHAPLRESKSFATLLSDQYGTALDERAQHYLQHIIAGSTRAQLMLNGLLHYSRLRIHPPFMQDNIDLHMLATLCAKNIQHAAAVTHAFIKVEPLPQVHADPKQMEQLLYALIDNSLKFASPDRPAYIHISGAQMNKGWRFCVQDNGIGIEKADCEKIFQPFKQLHPQGKYPGIGIGLAIAHAIVEQHGGRIWVESVPNQGSTFWFTLLNPTEKESNRA